MGGGHGERPLCCSGQAGNPKVGKCMKRHRKIVPTTLLPAVLGALALIPAPAVAGSLLNGYGGPGEGNQAILGSALVNGPRGGGGRGGSTGESSSGLAASAPVEAIPTGPRTDGGGGTAPGGTAPGRSGASRHGSTPGGHRGEATGGVSGSAGKSSTSAASAYAAAERGAAARLASDGSGTLGLSSGDFLYILLALGVLAVTGVLTRRLTRVATASMDS
jgi:hypothetical protein